MSKSTHINIPLFIPEEACPNRCVFCNQHTISGKAKPPGRDEIIETIETWLSTSTDATTVHIAFFGGNFTGLPLNEQKKYLDLATAYIDQNRVHGIRLSTRPDYISPETVSLLQKYRIAEVELGLQSADDEVLTASGRGHTMADVYRAVDLLKGAGISFGLQMMLGLPGDTKVKAMQTAGEIIALGASSTRIYPCLVIEGTELANLYNRNGYKPLSLEESVDWGKDVLRLFVENSVRVLRVGLHASEALRKGEGILAGPFHPAMKEMFLSAIWWDLLEPIARSPKSKTLQIAVSPQQLNYAIGYKGQNRTRLLETFDSVKIVANTGLSDFGYLLNE